MESHASLDSSRCVEEAAGVPGNESYLADFNDTLNDSRSKISMKRSISRASFRQSFRSSKSKLDEFFKSPLDFGLKRKRSRREEDCVSLASEDFSLEEPKNKRRSSLAKVTSLAALLSPVAPAKKVGHALQKSLSSWTLKSIGNTKGQYRDPVPTPPRRRTNSFWHETVNAEQLRHLTKSDIDRQEAIYEVLKSEEDLIEDMTMIKTTYHNSMVKLQLMTETELDQLFGHLTALIPLHQDLVEELRKLRDENGCIEHVGPTLSQWMPRLDCYVAYCSNQVYSKSLLDSKRHDRHIRDFLERCQESSFSRHLDLWSFLDVPRSRLVKYPLLIRTILKYTPAGHPDVTSLETAVQSVDRIICDVDHATGLSKCSFIKQRLSYSKDIQNCAEVEDSKMILCEGPLRTARGTKLYVCLFDKVLVLTRPSTVEGSTQYQLYKSPIPAAQLHVEDTAVTGAQQLPADQAASSSSGVVRSSSSSSSSGKAVVRSSSNSSTGGSFKRSVFQSGSNGSSLFRVSLRSPDSDETSLSVVLQANDELGKQHWLRCLDNAIAMATGGTGSPVELTSSSSQISLDTTITARPPKLVRRSLMRSKVLLTKKRRSLVKEPDQGGYDLHEASARQGESSGAMQQSSDRSQQSSDRSQMSCSDSTESAVSTSTQESQLSSDRSQQSSDRSQQSSYRSQQSSNPESSKTIPPVLDSPTTIGSGNILENILEDDNTGKLPCGDMVTTVGLGAGCKGGLERVGCDQMGGLHVMERVASSEIVDGIESGCGRRGFNDEDEIDVDECAEMFRDDDIVSLDDGEERNRGSVAISSECRYIDGSAEEEEFDL